MEDWGYHLGVRKESVINFKLRRLRDYEKVVSSKSGFDVSL